MTTVDASLILRRAASLVASIPGLPHAELVASIRPSIRILTEADGKDAPVGDSRFGGLPDLPAPIEWPTDPDSPLMFVAQIDLARLGDPTGLLPSAGLISFFFDVVRTPSGEHREASRVLYTKPGAALERRSPPAPEPAVLGARTLTTHLVATIPAWLEGIADWPDGARDAYAVLAEKTLVGGPPFHRMLGWPFLVQGPVEIDEPADDWVLLLQIDSDDSLPICWDDSGSLYFWIRKQDLAERRFDCVRAIIQSC